MAETTHDAAAAASPPTAEPKLPAAPMLELFAGAPDSLPGGPDRIEPALDINLETKPEPAAAASAPELPPPSVDEAIALADAILRERRPSLLRRYSLRVAAVAVAMALGGFLGAAATLELTRAPTSGTATAAAAIAAAASTAADENRALKDTVSRLNGELGKLKSSFETVNRTTTAQLGKLSERLDRAEKVVAEPAAKIARLSESVERLERHPAPTPLPPPTLAAPANANTNASADVTGSVASAEKPSARPPVADGWYVLDFYSGRALVENRYGTLYEVGPGSSLPGLGRVESVKRQDGQVMVVTAKGIITASLETRRPQRYMPYRY